MNRYLLFLVFLFAALLTSCQNIPAVRENSLDGTSWSLESYGDMDLLPETTMTASFNKGEVNGSASCNHYFASYSQQGNRLTIEGLGWTEMACLNPDGIMEQEQAVMALLGSAIEYQIQHSTLVIKSETGEELVFSLQKSE